MTLRSKIIRLAYEKPQLRPDLLPLLKVARKTVKQLAQEAVKSIGEVQGKKGKPPSVSEILQKAESWLRSQPDLKEDISGWPASLWREFQVEVERLYKIRK